MAQANHEIRLSVVDKTGAAINALEKRLDKISSLAKNILVGTAAGAKAGVDVISPVAKRNLDDYVKTLGVLDKRLGGFGRRLGEVAKAFDFGGKTVVGVAGINALSEALQDLPRWLGGANTDLQAFSNGLNALTSPINAVTDAIQALGPAGVATAGGIAAATAAVMAYGPALRKAGKEAEAFAESFRGSIEVTQDIISEKTLRDALSAATTEQKKLSAGTREYTQKTEEVLAIQRELTAELRRQQTVLNMVNDAQIRIADSVKRNINASRRTRQASGFAAFSQEAGAQTAIDKSIRRKRERQARIAAKSTSPAQVAAAPLMLPSSEMLQATERGIFRISKKAEVFPKIAKDFDRIARTGNNRVDTFVDRLKKGVDVSSELPSIFQQAGEALKRMNESLEVSTPQRRATQAADGVASLAKTQAAQTKNILEGNYGLKTRFNLYQQLLKVQVEQLKIAKEHRREAIRRRDAIRDIRKARRKQLNEDLMLGAGFPLLTGQGPGGVLGGVAGAIAGQGRGGFGTQIFFSALGAQLDTLGSKAIQLGQSLDPLSGDIEEVAEAAGLAGTNTKNLLGALKGQISQTQAAELAADQLAVVIGEDGVNALRELGKETNELGREASKAFSAIAASLAPILTAVVKPVTSEVERARLLTRAPEFAKTDPEIGKLVEQFRGSQAGTIGEALNLEDRIVELVRQREEAEKAAADAKLQGINTGRSELSILQLQNKIKRLNTDLTDENNAYLQEQVLRQKAANQEYEVGAKFASGEITKAQYINDLNTIKEKLVGNILDLEKDIADQKERQAKADQREAERAAREAERAAREAQRLQEKADRAARATRALEIDLQLSQSLTKQTQAIAEARRSGNSELVFDLEVNKRLTALSAEQAKILNENISLEDQRLKIAIAREKAALDLINLEQAELDRKKAVEDAVNRNIRSIENEINLSKARIEGTEEEVKIQQQLAAIKENIKGIDDADLERIRSRLVLLQEQLATEKAIQEVRDIEKRTSAAGAGLSAGFIGQAGQAFEQQIQKGATKERATEIALLTENLELAELQASSLENAVLGIGDAFAIAMTTGVSELIAGTKTAEEVFSDFLKNIGDTLIQAAQQMIATYIAIGIARAFAGMSGGSTKGPNLDAIEQYSNINANTPVSPLANGGPARAGQPYMVGERGPELFVPSNNGGVMRNEDMRQLMGRSPAASNAPQMNFSFETTNIGGQEFVSREQLEAAMATTRRQAANDGAKRGMSMTLDKMQNSPRTRSRIGIS